MSKEIEPNICILLFDIIKNEYTVSQDAALQCLTQPAIRSILDAQGITIDNFMQHFGTKTILAKASRFRKVDIS